MQRFVHIARLLLLVVALVALTPIIRLVVDWVELSRVLTGPAMQVPVRGFDWVLWQEDEGVIRASYVLPQGPAAEEGIRPGDIFFTLEYQQYFNAEDLKRAIEGIPPGTTRTYAVQRDGQIIEADVTFTRYPTFLYPLSGALWQFSIWGFTLGAFFHVLGLIIVGPLALRSHKARFSLLLILVSSLWIFSNLLRLLLVELLGPPLAIGGPYDRFFQMLTSVGLFGWIGFPALLVQKVLFDTQLVAQRRIGRSRYLIYLPPLVLGLAALVTTLQGSLGPLTLEGLVAPILFYASCYVATAALLILLLYLIRPEEVDDVLGGWSRPGNALMLLAALFFALAVLGIVPIFGAATDTAAGWLIVSAQLLSIAPVVLVSHATLKHGKVDQVLSTGLMYVTMFGFIFFTFVGGLSLIEPYLARFETSRNVVAGLYAVVLLFLFERLARRTRGYAASFFTSERHLMYQTLNRFQEQMRTILDFRELAHQTIQVTGQAFGTRSAVIFLRAPAGEGLWFSSSYHPEPPYLTERTVARIWPHLQREGRIWARNPELNESTLPADLGALLHARGAALVVPILGKDAPIGLIALGPKKRRRAVYNLEEMDLLRSLSGQLALALERLQLVEREKALVRESAEAQLVALRAQINPHFLFNALNTIVSLIEERPEEAEATVEHLAAIFRYILQTGSRPFVTLEEELSLVNHYLSIEQSRFGPSLTVEQHIDPMLRTHPVPAFAVQTLVENAVKHGLARRRGGGLLRIDGRPAGAEAAEITVADTGVGIPELFEGTEADDAPDHFFGIGLRNVATRLRQLYGRDDLLHLASTPGTGTVVRLLLPPSDRSEPAPSARPGFDESIRMDHAPRPAR